MKDDDLWDHVKKSVKPIHKKPATKKTTIEKPKLLASSKPVIAAKAPAKMTPKPAQSIAFDTRLKQKLKRGTATLDATLDLHGMTQDAAYKKIKNFIAKTDARLILIITGKGMGILQKMLPEWLMQESFARYIVAFSQAHRHHGDHGAFYVHLKKNKE